VNKLQRNALAFAYRVHSLNKGWSAFAGDKLTSNAIYGLHNCRLIKVNNHRQFKITAFGVEQYLNSIK